MAAAGICLAVVLIAGCGGTATRSDSSGKAAAATSSVKEKFTRDNWAQLVSNPDAHKGAQVDLVGKLLQVSEKDNDGSYWQMWADPANSEWNVVVGYADASFSASSDAYVHVVGTVKGKYEGENMLGGKVTAVAIVATKAEVVDALAAATPAQRTSTSGKSITQHGITVTLEKVEFASDETRVFVKVTNGTTSKASFYSFNGKATQGSKQYDASSSLATYPEVQSEILPGIVSSGVRVSGDELFFGPHASSGGWV
jgi:hypothetical protein